MSCAGEPYFLISVHTAGRYIFHEQRVDVLGDIFVERPALTNTFLHIGKGFGMVCHFVNFTRFFSVCR